VDTLTQRLAASDQKAQPAIVEEHASAADAAELVRLLALPPFEVAPRAQALVTHVLTGRGLPALEAVAAALMADPLAPAGRRLAEVLAGIFRADPPLRPRVTATLVAAISAAVDQGADSWAIGEMVGWLAECAQVGGPLREAVPLGWRLVRVIGRESNPYLPGLDAAKQLARARGPAPDPFAERDPGPS
jgi:hypothetical protein